jgi:hypothetical protein
MIHSLVESGGSVTDFQLDVFSFLQQFIIHNEKGVNF